MRRQRAVARAVAERLSSLGVVELLCHALRSSTPARRSQPAAAHAQDDLQLRWVAAGGYGRLSRLPRRRAGRPGGARLSTAR